MGAEVLIKVENIKKKFCRSLKRSMLYGVQDISKDILGLDNKSENLRKDEFWSLDDISFEVKRGECLGIIGANGAGKSTLLKILNGIILPDGGKVTTIGKVGALIEVGSGFHPMLSGRENIYLNGSILGMSKKELDDKFDSIVEFAELKDSIDMPVKHYSSGMYVRLGFSVAAHVKPDVLILDEILAVGDMAFVAKCFRHLSKIRKSTAIIMVSHDMKNISRICDKVLFIENGRENYIGRSEKGIREFRKSILHTNNEKFGNIKSDIIVLEEFRSDDIIEQFSDYLIEMKVRIKNKKKFMVNIGVYREDGVHCFGVISSLYDANYNKSEIFKIKLLFNNIELMPGSYYFNVNFLDEYKTGIYSIYQNVKKMMVVGNEETQGIYKPEYKWY